MQAVITSILLKLLISSVFGLTIIFEAPGNIYPGFEKVKSVRLALEFNAPFIPLGLGIEQVEAVSFPAISK